MSLVSWWVFKHGPNIIKMFSLNEYGGDDAKHKIPTIQPQDVHFLTIFPLHAKTCVTLELLCYKNNQIKPPSLQRDQTGNPETHSTNRESSESERQTNKTQSHFKHANSSSATVGIYHIWFITVPLRHSSQKASLVSRKRLRFVFILLFLTTGCISCSYSWFLSCRHDFLILLMQIYKMSARISACNIQSYDFYF